MNPIRADYHIHTKLCKHASGDMEEYVRHAIRAGLTEIAFTDHIPLPDGFDRAHRMEPEQLSDYMRRVGELQQRYRNRINILLGIEADFIDGFEKYLEQTLSAFPFDLVILSVHFIKHWPGDQWVFRYDFPEKSLMAVYDEYLQAVRRGIETGLFDVVGHLDLIKRPEQPLLQANRETVTNVLQAAAKHSMAVEINTSGWRKEIGEPYPSPEILPLIRELGLPVTVGSDAHGPNQVGYGFDRVAALLEQNGIAGPVSFNKRQWIA